MASAQGPAENEYLRLFYEATWSAPATLEQKATATLLNEKQSKSASDQRTDQTKGSFDPALMSRMFDPSLEDRTRLQLLKWNQDHQFALREKYSYAIPTEAALAIVAQVS